MGLLRVLLAAMVVFVHAGPLPGFPTMSGSLAVQTFYMISGFYMALILNEKYIGQTHPYRLFLLNRVLRLLPIYYVIFSLALLIAAVPGAPELEFFRALRANHEQLSASTTAFLIVSNLTLIGQDWLSFLTVDPATGTLVFTSDFARSRLNLNSFLLVQPAWTVSVELAFYVVAPLIVRRRTWVLLLIMLVSVGIRLALRWYANFDTMAWSYRFFPSELLYFVAGALAYRGYKWLKGTPLTGWVCPLVLVITLSYTLFFGLIHEWLVVHGVPNGVSSAVYRLAVALSLPFLFMCTRSNQLDNRIGELSYPLYLIHFLVWESLAAWEVGGRYVNLYTLVLSLVLSYGLNRLVGDRIERVRQRVFKQQSPTRPSLA